MGGMAESGENSKAMFELSQSMEWTRLEQTFQIDTHFPLAIPIPDELVNEKIEAKNTKPIKTVHEEQKDHKCETCSKEFGTRSNRNLHIKTVHAGQKYHKCYKYVKYQNNS